MYEDFVLIGKRDFNYLLKFFAQMVEEVCKKVKIDVGVKNLIDRMKNA